MLIAIDFDETLTRDAGLWSQFICVARKCGHRIVCVTARCDTEDDNDTIDEWMQVNAIDLPVFFTSMASKVDHMKSIGQPVDIWIDDDPRKCAMGH